MDKRLKKYNSVSSSLGFMVENLRKHQGSLQTAIDSSRDIIRGNDTMIKNFKNAVY